MTAPAGLPDLAERFRFVAGQTVDTSSIDVGDDRAIARLLDPTVAAADDLPTLRVVQLEVAKGILRNDPPELWETAQRLRALEPDHRRVWGELMFALAHARDDAGRDDVPEGSPLALSYLIEALHELPLPRADEIEARADAICQQQPGLHIGDLEAQLLSHFDTDEGLAGGEQILEEVQELIDDRLLTLR